MCELLWSEANSLLAYFLELLCTEIGTVWPVLRVLMESSSEKNNDPSLWRIAPKVVQRYCIMAQRSVKLRQSPTFQKHQTDCPSINVHQDRCTKRFLCFDDKRALRAPQTMTPVSQRQGQVVSLTLVNAVWTLFHDKNLVWPSLFCFPCCLLQG